MKDKNTSLAVVAGLGLIGVFLGLVFISGAIALFGALLAWIIWNHILAGLFHGPQLGYWQVFGVLWLVNFLTGIIRALFR